MITINVYNVDHTNANNYITSIEIPNYKQMGRTLKFLRDYVKRQRANDFNHRIMRFYVFHSNTFLIKQTDLTI